MPPRQRPGANLDDSRSEASSGARDRQGAAVKGRRTTNPPTTGNTAAAGKDVKTSAKLHAAEAVDATQSQDGRIHISWSSMPLSVLHDYRHAYNLPCPSAYSSQINSILLSQGIGLRSPTSLAARTAKTSSSTGSKPAQTQNHQSNSANKPSETPSTKPNNTTTTPTAATTATDTTPSLTGESIPPLAPPPPQARSGQANLRRVQGQDRVSKDHLAAAVRKHFNNVAISEQDAVARFLYKVREERKGRAFRLRFQP